MSIESLPTDNIETRKRKALEQILETRIRWHIDNVIKAEEKVPVTSDTYLQGLDSLIEKFKKVIPEKEAELLDIRASVKAQNIEDGEEFVKVIKEKIAEFMLANFTFEEIESLSRQGKRMLNRLVEYNVKEEEIDIHVPVTFLESPAELRPLFIDAMKKLADKLKNDLEFKNIKTVFAKSWIVFETHRALAKLGFTILEIDEENKNGSAEISKEKLIEIYG